MFLEVDLATTRPDEADEPELEEDDSRRAASTEQRTTERTDPEATVTRLLEEQTSLEER